ncbi:MAG TPA: polysaccharide pyruvyl transferase family protein [Candidatus Dormibacteraeota bacterium]|nr:polysaccharide pyruvyl transferase family protein [Candidatus Dormibacteraeota bacterium]
MDSNQAADHVYRIGISGSYGGLNLGDEAILQSIMTQLRASVPCEITVFSRDAKDTAARHKVEKSIPVRDLSRDEVRPEVAELDLLILGGGGILYDEAAAIYLREVELAQEHSVPVLVYAVSAGPLHDAAARTLVRDTLSRVDAVTVRERRAQQLLEEVGVRDIEVTADPAFLLEPEPLPEDALQREGLNKNRRLIGFSVREPGSAAPDIDETHYHALLANAADYMVDRLDADLVFVPMEPRQKDTQHCHAVVSKMAHAHQATVLKGEYTSGQLLSLISHFDFAVGMRLHFLIFAAINRVPFVALPYSSKVAGFLEDLEIAMPPLKQVNAGQLIAYIDRWWDLRRNLQARLEKSVPEIQTRARRTNEIAMRLLTERRDLRSAEAGRGSA